GGREFDGRVLVSQQERFDGRGRWFVKFDPGGSVPLRSAIGIEVPRGAAGNVDRGDIRYGNRSGNMAVNVSVRLGESRADRIAINSGCGPNRRQRHEVATDSGTEIKNAIAFRKSLRFVTGDRFAGRLLQADR